MVNPYKSMPKPWLSKSKLITYDYCPYDFYQQYELKKPKTKHIKAIEGTNMHMVFAKFFEQIQPKHIFKDEYTDSRTQIRKHPFRRFIYDICMRFVKPEQREYGKYKNIISNFATIETQRFLRLNRIIRNQDKIFEYFRPLYIEKRLEYEPLKLFGTIDRVNAMIMNDGSVKVAIFDYKTGNVPKSILKHKEDTLDIFDWDLPTSKMKEIHFYALLYSLMSGYTVSDELREFLTQPEWFFLKKGGRNYKETQKYKKDYLTSLGDKYKPKKEGKALEKDTFVVGYYFLNGAEKIGRDYIPKAYRPIKQINYNSMKSVYLLINEVRSIWHNNHFIKHPLGKEVCQWMRCHSFFNCYPEERDD